MTNECLIYPPSHCKVILNVSYLSFFTGMYALYREKYDLALVPFSVGITSQLYWRNPIRNCSMRYIDILTVIIGLFYQLHYAYYSNKIVPYASTVLIALLFYPISNFYYDTNLWLSVYLYSLLHVFANISNIILYS